MPQILCILGSPRKNGNTEVMMEAFHEGAIKTGADSKLLLLREIDLRGCDGCEGCNTNRHCHIEDDMQSIYPLLEKADVWVFSSPVYWWNISGLLKNFIDRFEVYWGDARFKELCAQKKAVILTCGGQSMEKNKEAETYLELFCTKLHLKIAGKIRASADEKGAVSDEVLSQCRELGEKIGRGVA